MNNFNNNESIELLSNKEMKSINGGIFGIIIVGFFALAAFGLGNAIGNSFDNCE